MTLTFMFWFCMFLWLLGILGVWFRPEARWPVVGSSVVMFILFLLVGLKLFGHPITGG